MSLVSFDGGLESVDKMLARKLSFPKEQEIAFVEVVILKFQWNPGSPMKPIARSVSSPAHSKDPQG